MSSDRSTPSQPVPPMLNPAMLNPAPAQESHRDETPAPLQFRLRSLLLLVGLCSVLFAALTAFDTLWAAMLVLFVMMIVAHVAAAAISVNLQSPSRRSRQSRLPEVRLRRGQARTVVEAGRVAADDQGRPGTLASEVGRPS